MNSAEIMDFLIKSLAGDNASEFGRRTGIDGATIARIRKGNFSLKKQVNKICEAYPQVNRTFIETGEGYPGDLNADMIRERYRRALEEKENLIATLTEELRIQQMIISHLTEKSK